MFPLAILGGLSSIRQIFQIVEFDGRRASTYALGAPTPAELRQKIDPFSASVVVRWGFGPSLTTPAWEVPQQAAVDSSNSAFQSADGYHPAAADSVSSYLGIDPTSVDANIRAGKTDVIDGLGYARNSFL